MKVSELRKRFPVIHGRDHGGRRTIVDIVKMLGDALDAQASKESVEEIAVDILDREFFFGAWGDRWKDSDLLLRDLRGLVVAAYRIGRTRAEAE